MKYGIAIRNMGAQSSRATILACARAAEAAGFDAIFVSDHLCIPPGETEGSGGRYLDVLAALAYLAGATEHIRLGVSVLVLPYRPAVLTAKQIATIQELSGGRMILGVGVGWMKPEFEALGVDMKKRGALATETLRVIRHLFDNPEPAPFGGKLVNFPAFVFEPHPARPPIWIGGGGPNAIQRVLEFGDGWHPMRRAAELKPLVEDLRGRMRAAGRPDPEIIVRRGLKLADIAAARDRLDAEREAGATYFILDLGRYADQREFAAAAETFISKVAH
ncbi:MAG TPA: TIGR03619 family F420-dependent LLM class oxidoreductase [Candidatus Binataceae bacterium]|nr:TIGR03619 family F420-dependent LLM class oxidoreductase [Candidatus Binataceae bacterium]